jgi:hypothetical protein
MAEKVEKCGTKTIRYPSECTYSCVCPGGSGPCAWTVICNGTVFTGTGLIQGGSGGSKHPHVTLAGDLVACAKALQRAWSRRVTVPANLRRARIRRRTLRGTPEQIADALGLQLGPRTRAKTPRSKGDFVSIKV